MVSYRAAVMCLVAISVLATRNVPATFPHGSRSASFHSLADHDHRSCFDHENSEWATAPENPLTTPPVVSSPLMQPADALAEFVTDGWHYNRPPPLS